MKEFSFLSEPNTLTHPSEREHAHHRHAPREVCYSRFCENYGFKKKMKIK